MLEECPCGKCKSQRGIRVREVNGIDPIFTLLILAHKSIAYM
jgi:hypothetical protein